MLNILFVTSLAIGLMALIVWGVRTLPGERWQMLAAVPVEKESDGSWRGLNLTFYGFFSATGTTFGFAMMLLLLGSVGLPASIDFLLILLVLLVCIPASRLIAGIVERKRHTFTVAGAAFVATIIIPWVILALRTLGARRLNCDLPVVPTFAALSIAYVLGESVGRLACLSFGCCYGMPLCQAHANLAKIFQRHNLVIRGQTKKAAYAAGLAGEPLIPVQAISSVIFATSGVAGLVLFVLEDFRLAALIPVLASWGWRACSEFLRADYRGASRISVYQVMAAIAAVFFVVFVLAMPQSVAAAPDLWTGFTSLAAAPVILALQFIWFALFLFYGRSRVTASTLSFHVVPDRI